MDRAAIRALRAGRTILNLAGDGDERRILRVRHLPDTPSGCAVAVVAASCGRGWIMTRVIEGGPEIACDAAAADL